MSDPKPKIVNLPAPEVLWSLAVKARDGKCIACDSPDELVAVLLDGKGIVGEQGTLDLGGGVTLCARCHLKASKDEKFRAGLPAMLKPIKAARLNIEIDGNLYAKFQAVCRFRSTTVSRAVRELITAHMEAVEDVGSN
jgi:hypothetical protein